jgi:flagellar protein FliT
MSNRPQASAAHPAVQAPAARIREENNPMTQDADRESRIIACYEMISHATGRMLVAARKNDWNTVVSAESECSLIIDELKKLGDLVPSDLVLRQRKAEIIRKVLADDAEIRNLTQPWLRKLDGYLQSASSHKKLGRISGNTAACGE